MFRRLADSQTAERRNLTTNLHPDANYAQSPLQIWRRALGARGRPRRDHAGDETGRKYAKIRTHHSPQGIHRVRR